MTYKEGIFPNFYQFFYMKLRHPKNDVILGHFDPPFSKKIFYKYLFYVK